MSAAAHLQHIAVYCTCITVKWCVKALEVLNPEPRTSHWFTIWINPFAETAHLKNASLIQSFTQSDIAFW